MSAPAAPRPELRRLCVHTITTQPWPVETAAARFAAAGVGGITVWTQRRRRSGSGAAGADMTL
ncbi:MAG: hypothetical protein ACKOTE_15075 [Opitutaceae bacterium]